MITEIQYVATLHKKSDFPNNRGCQFDSLPEVRDNPRGIITEIHYVVTLHQELDFPNNHVPDTYRPCPPSPFPTSSLSSTLTRSFQPVRCIGHERLLTAAGLVGHPSERHTIRSANATCT